MCAQGLPHSGKILPISGVQKHVSLEDHLQAKINPREASCLGHVLHQLPNPPPPGGGAIHFPTHGSSREVGRCRGIFAPTSSSMLKITGSLEGLASRRAKRPARTHAAGTVLCFLNVYETR